MDGSSSSGIGSDSNNSGSSSSSSGSSGSSSGNSSGSGSSSSSSSSGSGSNWNYRMNIIVPTATGAEKANRYSPIRVDFKDLMQIDKFQKACAYLNNQFFSQRDSFVQAPLEERFNDTQPLRQYCGLNDVVTSNGIIPYHHYLLIAYSFSGTAIEGVDYMVDSEYYDPVKKVGIIYDHISQLNGSLIILPYRKPYAPERTIKFDFKFMLVDLRTDITDHISYWHNWNISDLSSCPHVMIDQFNAESWAVPNGSSQNPMYLQEDYHIGTPDFLSWPKFSYSVAGGDLTDDEINYLDGVFAGKGTTVTILEPDPVLKCALAEQSKSNIKLNETTVIQVSHDIQNYPSV